jgi:hypothetical protein
MHEVGCGFAFGCPNEIAYKVGKRLLGYRDLCEIPILTRRMNFRLAVRFRIGSQLLEHLVRRFSNWGYRLRYAKVLQGFHRGIQIEQVREFDDAFDRFWQRISGMYSILAVRDRTYLQWRYQKHPQGGFHVLRALRHGTMVGYLVWRAVKSPIGEESIYIADFLTIDDRQVAVALLRHVIAMALLERADTVKIGVVRHHLSWDLLQKEGFRERGESLKMVHGQYTNSDLERLCAEPSRWFLMLGDTDFLEAVG